jgi:hypothetical protein
VSLVSLVSLIPIRVREHVYVYAYYIYARMRGGEKRLTTLTLSLKNGRISQQTQGKFVKVSLKGRLTNPLILLGMWFSESPSPAASSPTPPSISSLAISLCAISLYCCVGFLRTR